MMSSTSHSLKVEAEHSFDSAVWFDAESAAGVRFAIARLTFGRRLDLARRIREIGRRAEFLAAGGRTLATSWRRRWWGRKWIVPIWSGGCWRSRG